MFSNSRALDPQLAARNEEERDLDLHVYRHSQAQKNDILFNREIGLDVLIESEAHSYRLVGSHSANTNNYVSSVCSIQSHSSSQSLLLHHIRIFLFSPNLLRNHQIRVSLLWCLQAGS